MFDHIYFCKEFPEIQVCTLNLVHKRMLERKPIFFLEQALLNTPGYLKLYTQGNQRLSIKRQVGGNVFRSLESKY